MGKVPFFPTPHQGEYTSARKSHIESLRAQSPALQALHLNEQNAEKATKEASQ